MTLHEFEQLLSPLLPTPRPKSLALGVSSGADSLCLAFLMGLWGQKIGCEIWGLTVQHEPDSFPEEATFPAKILPKWGVRHAVLHIPSLPQQQGIQARARHCRYQALSLFCHNQGIAHLCLAHHQDDQLETWAMRLASGSGFRGLSGMLPTTSYQGITLLRPFLTIPQKWLSQTLLSRGISWLEDPSNQDHQFQRVRFRMPLQKISSEERTFWIGNIRKQQEKRFKEEQHLTLAFQKSCTLNPKGFIRIRKESWKSCDLTTQHLLLEKILRMVGGQQLHPLSRASLDRTIQNIQRTSFCRTTLGGCLIEKIHSGLQVTREWQRIQPYVLQSQETSFIWDRRWHIKLSRSFETLTIRPQGSNGGKLSASLPELSQGETCLWPKQDTTFLTYLKWVWSDTPLLTNEPTALIS